MNEQTNKGPLIQKKAKPNSLSRPKPVLVAGKDDFKFSSKESIDETTVQVAIKEKEQPIVVPEKKVQTVEPEKKKSVPLKRASIVGKNNNVKSIKVPNDLHVKIGVLGKFMDENKTYAIISELVDYYVKNDLTDRQQKQFGYMTDFLHDPEE